MKILVLNGSPRPNGTTKKMVNAFKNGAESASHQVMVADVCQKKIAGCLACEYCHNKGQGACIQKDDMQEIYELLKEAEMLIIASPIYYHGLSGQLKCVIVMPPMNQAAIKGGFGFPVSACRCTYCGV